MASISLAAVPFVKGEKRRGWMHRNAPPARYRRPSRLGRETKEPAPCPNPLLPRSSVMSADRLHVNLFPGPALHDARGAYAVIISATCLAAYWGRRRHGKIGGKASSMCRQTGAAALACYLCALYVVGTGTCALCYGAIHVRSRFVPPRGDGAWWEVTRVS